MDLVYPYRSAPFDFELRYSLRSLVNLPHDRVIIAGDRPQIASDRVTCIDAPRHQDRYQSSAANILAGCEASDADQVVVMNDDMFILRPWSFRHENRGTIAGYLASGRASGRYRAALEATRDILAVEGISDPLFFGLHTPTVYDRRALMDLIREYQGRGILLRTLYHNLHPKPSVRAEDVKLHRFPSYRPPAVGDALSISDEVASQPAFRRWIAERFPERCDYERQGRCLILGYGESLWDDLAAHWGSYDAVIASPEAAEHWPGPLLAVANDDGHARMLAEGYGFEDVVICGATEAA